MKTRLIMIDGDKLRYEIESRGLKLGEVSEEMGFARDYLGNCCAMSGQKISRIALSYLKAIHGIMPETYSKEFEKQEEPVIDTPPVVAIDYTELARAIWDECPIKNIDIETIEFTLRKIIASAMQDRGL